MRPLRKRRRCAPAVAGDSARYAEGYAVTAMDYDEEGWADIPDQHAHALGRGLYPWPRLATLEVTPGVRLSTGELNQQAQDALSEDSSTPESEAESSSEPESSSPESSSALEDSSALGSDETNRCNPVRFPHLAARVGWDWGGSRCCSAGCPAAYFPDQTPQKAVPFSKCQPIRNRYLQVFDRLNVIWGVDRSLFRGAGPQGKFSQHTLTEEEMNALLSDADRAAHETYRTLPWLASCSLNMGNACFNQSL